MNDNYPGERTLGNLDDQPVDVAIVARDSALLDAVGRGAPAPDGDEVLALLAAWRADLAAEPIPATLSQEHALAAESTRALTAEPTGALTAEAAMAPVPEPTIRRWGGRSRLIVAVAAAVIGFAGFLTILAADAGPDDPLWPITRMVYQDTADSRTAQQEAQDTLTQARTAVTDGRYTDAALLLDQAEALTDRVHERDVVDRLHAEVAALRGLLPGAPAVPPASPPGGAPVPPATATPGTGATSPGPSVPDPRRTTGDKAPGLPLPGLPVTTAPASPGRPLPGLPLPSLPLPGLPLPSILPGR